MFDLCCKSSLPASLASYYQNPETLFSIEDEREVCLPDIIINRDKNGEIYSVCYYSPDRMFVKEVSYGCDDKVVNNYYCNGRLYAKKEFANNLLIRRISYKKNGMQAFSYEYEYNRQGQIVEITKKTSQKKLAANYQYDDFGRIVCRKIYLDNKGILEQTYRYDILDRVIDYCDENQHISVLKLSKKNELLSYVITDRMNNEIRVENLFSEQGYFQTEISVNGHCSVVKDTSYVDNIMLKKPYTNENDLDLIIANLFGQAEKIRTTRVLESDIDGRAENLIDNGISLRVLPISMRKRLLYNSIMMRVS